VSAGFFLPVFSTPTNCGGNSAALNEVHGIALAALVYASDAPDHSFRFTTPTARQREELAHYGRTPWCRGARFLVSTAPISEKQFPLRREPEAQRRVITVCDTPYTNVPRRRFGSAPPTHAAGYSDGSYGLISLAEFAALDRTTFVPIDELYPSEAK
jgi:hypothetical protein